MAGIDEIRALPEVTLHRPYARPGARLPGGVHTQDLDVVLGETAPRRNSPRSSRKSGRGCGSPSPSPAHPAR
ncbi:hypothetical protein ACFQ2B_05825 [Streptomyces stramineus]